jgi:hypothetical protein
MLFPFIRACLVTEPRFLAQREICLAVQLGPLGLLALDHGLVGVLVPEVGERLRVQLAEYVRGERL